MPGGGLFIRQGYAQKRGFVEGAADQLQADRQPLPGEPAGEGDCGQAGEVPGKGKAQERRANDLFGTADLHFLFVDARGYDGYGGDGQDIHRFQNSFE